MKDIGLIIKRRREELCYTQVLLAQMIGRPGHSGEAALQSWEHNRRPVPRKWLRALARALKLPVSELIP